MKSIGIGIVVLLAAVTLSARSIVVSPTGFSTPSPEFVYTNMKFPSMLQETKAKDNYNILGEVHGTSTSRNILNIAAIIGTKGLSQPSRFKMGSVAAKVVKHSPCSVYVVKI